jgi:hypothetical protein
MVNYVGEKFHIWPSVSEHLYFYFIFHYTYSKSKTSLLTTSRSYATEQMNP